MSKTAKPTAPETPAPAFDAGAATAVPPKRHEASARTVGSVQLAGAEAHLFSATRDFIGTVTAKEAAKFLPKAKPAADPMPAPAPAPIVPPAAS